MVGPLEWRMGVDRVRTSLAGSVAAIIAVLAQVSLAAPVTVDGSIEDWGVKVQDGTGSVSETFVTTTIKFNDSTGTNYFYGGSNVRSGNSFFQKEDGMEGTGDGQAGAPQTPGRREDIYDQLASGLVDPNVGGQNYDAEWMGTGLEGDTLYLAILSGQRPDNGFGNYAPGDLRLVVKNNGAFVAEFAIEMGGGVGGYSGTGGNSELGGTTIKQGYTGSTYVLNDSGTTYKVLTAKDNGSDPGLTNEKKYWGASSGESGTLSPSAECGGGGEYNSTYGINEGQVAGSIWRMDDSSWILDPISGTSGITPGGKEKVQIGCGAEKVGMVDEYRYTRNTSTAQHGVMELSLNLNVLRNVIGSFTDLDIYWGPACGNDILEVNWPLPHGEVPAPAGLWLLGSALIGLATLRRRRAA